MVTLLALAPVAHAWLGNDGTYYWSGSGTADADAPAHQWVDVPNEPGAVMLDISFSDDASESLAPLGTGRYRYYGVEYALDQIWVSTNGVVLFTEGGAFVNSYCCSGQPIPSPNVGEPAIFPFWDDLNPFSGGEIWAVDTGTEIVIHYEGVAFFPNSGANSFQVGLRQDGTFRISVDTLSGNGGSNIAMGHQLNGNRGNQIYLNAALPPQNVTLLFQPDLVDDDGDGFTDLDDCNDNDPDVNPAVVDTVCDGVVSDCSPASSESDSDGDGFRACDGDCDDQDFFTNPNELEFCDGRDNNCDGAIDEGLQLTTFYIDADFDGWGDDQGESMQGCFAPPGFAPGGDCDDTDAFISPWAQEDCGPEDNNCDGDPFANAWDAQNYRPDTDGDGYGSGPNQRVCEVPPDAATQGGGDCDPDDPDIHPGASEIPYDGIDHNCDGYEELDRDEDGMSDADEFVYGSDWLDADTDDDGVLDPDEFDVGSDPNSMDSDGDGVLDTVEFGLGDSDSDSVADIVDDDDDDDGWDTAFEGTEDLDEDGIPNYLDDDSDGDGVLDIDETEDTLWVFDTEPPDTSDPDEPGGCGCASAGAPVGWVGLLLPLVLGRMRRTP